MSNNTSDSSLDGCMFIILFILVCLIRCDQVTESQFEHKTKEVENMIEYTQKELRDVKDELSRLRNERDSLVLYIKEENSNNH